MDTMKRQPHVLGITGSIGSGKSFVMRLLRLFHVPTCDADEIVHELLLSPSVVLKIASHFPECIRENQVDRKRLGSCVFQDTKRRKVLNRIIHPLVYDRLTDFIKRNSKEPLIALEIPLLFEVGWTDLCATILVACAPYDVRRERSLYLRHFSPELFQQIDAAQLSQDEKVRRADIILNTYQPKDQVARDLKTIVCDLVLKNA
jgi:dephospho-CoA kinase